ncbi:lipase maturation factor 2a [Callorhinchus milii]|nr:lipase maturation factor 2a [Callorhinchus milii]|eukprot:gi/632983755/ref/XP_007908805.1/ PREDICTED: lipase maturation factor 2 [Callorhinchus milii]
MESLRNCWLLGLSLTFLTAFSSLYLQLPGLYGKDGILPARRMLHFSAKPLLEQLKDAPTLLWLCPHLGLDTEQGMELICLLGSALSFAALLIKQLRDSIIFFCLWFLYLSLHQVGQVFLFFQWDSLLLEVGFLAVLVAPLHLRKWRSAAHRHHDRVTFWLVRWLFFRLMFASGVVKLTSRCPTWWGLTALTYHYESQCIPTPGAWFAHQLPVWLHKLSVVIVYTIEIAVPLLFFSPTRRLRIFSFYIQALLQILIIVTGNYNFFNLLSIVLSFSLLDQEHIDFWLRSSKKRRSRSRADTLQAWVVTLLELSVYTTLLLGTIHYFGLKVNWESQTIESSTAFTYHEFLHWLKLVIVPTIWLGVLSLTWEIVAAMLSALCVRGFFPKLWATLQCTIFAAVAASMFAVSLVPYTFIEYEANSNLWPQVQWLHRAVDRYQLVSSYGLFRRMTGVGGRPEVVLEGSYDRQIWMEIEFMYKPGNISEAPALVAPHQPRLDWQLWFAALAPHTHSPWFISFIQRLLEGSKDVTRLVQVDETRYPFSERPPTYLRAQLYRYSYTVASAGRSLPRDWWTRQRVAEFFPTVSLGDPTLESLLLEHGFKDKPSPRRVSESLLPSLLRLVREQTQLFTGPGLIGSLVCTALLISLARALMSRRPVGKVYRAANNSQNGQGKRK